MRRRSSRKVRTAALGALALVFALAFPCLAAAAEPLKIREAFPGSVAAGPTAEYVELQMSEDGQEDVVGQELRFYNGSGALSGTYVLSEGDVEDLAGDAQRTVLLATAEAGGLGGDAAAPDAILPSADRMSPAGGAVCFTAAGGGSPVDCVAWGGFPLPEPLEPSPIPDRQSANAPAIANGNSLERDISRGCPTLLDGLDDTSTSAGDFDLATPTPRNNAAEPDEERCPPAAGIVSGPVVPFANPTSSPDAAFTYAALPGEAGVEFQCHLDSSPSSLPPETPPGEGEWEACDTQPHTYTGLADGFHRFWVRARGENPAWGPAASRGWEIDSAPPQTAIDSSPPSPSSGFSAAFSYSSSEPLSSFRCQLDDGAVQNCGTSADSGSKTYFDLGDGSHVFRVWASDNAGNEDPSPAEHTFLVQTALGDATPPDTQILLAPPSPSSSPSAFFAYGSSEPGSNFECRLDGAPFGPCPRAGISYGPLPNAVHSFEVRAIDGAGNVDSVPASYSWRVAGPVPDTRITKAPGGAVRSPHGKPVTVRFSFKADRPGTTFRCRLDLTGPYRPCKSPARLKAAPGRHVFEVFAVDRLGNEEGTPAFRIFRVEAPGSQPSFFTRSGKLLSSLTARIAPVQLPREGLRPVSLRLGSTFENLDGSDIPQIRTMTLRLSSGGVLETAGLPRCSQARLLRQTSQAALATCRSALVGRGAVSTALRFPEGRRSRSSAELLLFNAGPRLLLMHIHATDPLEGVFVIPVRIRKTGGAFGAELRASFPRITAGYGRVTGFEMTLKRSYRAGGELRSYLLAGCPAPAGLNRVAFELARVTYTFHGGPRIQNSTINTCAVGG